MSRPMYEQDGDFLPYEDCPECKALTFTVGGCENCGFISLLSEYYPDDKPKKKRPVVDRSYFNTQEF